MTPVAKAVDTPRVIQGQEIVSPLGNAKLDPKAEKELRKEIVEKGLEALQVDVDAHTLFERNK